MAGQVLLDIGADRHHLRRIATGVRPPSTLMPLAGVFRQARAVRCAGEDAAVDRHGCACYPPGVVAGVEQDRLGDVLGMLCVPKTSSKSCDQAIFADQATDASLSSDPVLTEIDRLG